MWSCVVLAVVGVLHVRYSSGATLTVFADDGLSAVAGGNVSFAGQTRSTLNRDGKFGRWTSSRIPYRLDQNYSPFQKTAIREAMTQIQNDVSNCIRFTEYDSRTDMGEDFMNISPTENGVPQTTCSTSPGRDLSRKGRGQAMVMFAGAGGCMDNKRDIMKVLANSLGLRNEFSRPDRDNHLLIQPQNFRAEYRTLDLYRKYQPSEVEYQNFEFDLQSITMYSMERFAIPGTVAFHLVNPGLFIGNLPRLSKGDCQGLAAQYGCSASFCADAYIESNMAVDPKDKSIRPMSASWNLEDLSLFAKDFTHRGTTTKRRASRRRPFLIRPFALL
ncbi:hypothetical protein BV898_01959 [Hypsibius exemplaris]|uniref:Peptidase M12A domain-containing protein n=1 Tax=Hypsibius exemplaris TaxID=2072580 RepID=A0A1W0X9C2_HYPEX|nr:hypothetical protein BV898_01959 [Hypsibius exemplaris]